MGLALPLFFLAFATLVAMQFLSQKAHLASPGGPLPARQIAYNLRLYHQAAMAYKAANPAATGVLPVIPPGFLTEWRLTSCAASKSVMTFASGLDSATSRSLNDELLRQSIMPPELGIVGGSPDSMGSLPGKALRGYANGIGIVSGGAINNGFGALTPACPVPTGVAVIQTQVLQ